MGQRAALTFTDKLALGRRGELIVERWLKQARGCGVIPSYAFSGTDSDKAPRLRFSSEGYAVPDLDVCKAGDRYWVEVKTYWFAPLNRSLGAPVHGITSRLYADYMLVEEHSGCAVWLAILELEKAGSNSVPLLLQRLSVLEPFPCMCGCPVSFCKAPVKNGVYFRRSEFVELQVVDDDIGPLRADWRRTPEGQ